MVIFVIYISAFCFYELLRFLMTELCMWLKYGLKAQKLLAQGIALGVYGRKTVAL